LDLIVQKFGGTSVADAERVERVADIITDTYKKGNNVVAVVSAQGKFTDVLVDKANEINTKASKREMDMLLSAGEQISIALLAMAIEKRGFPVKSFLGWQAGFVTDSSHSNARIRTIKTERIENELTNIPLLLLPVSRVSTVTMTLPPSDAAVPIPAQLHLRLLCMRESARSTPMLTAFTPPIPAL
jgi:aspartate kinase